MKKFIPAWDYLLIKRIKEEEKTDGGLIIPQIARDVQQVCKVLAVGPGKFNEKAGRIVPVGIKQGEYVFVSKYAGTDILVERETYTVIAEGDVLGTVVEDNG